MRKIMFILSIILLILCLSGCVIKDDGYDEKVKELEAIYAPKFIEEAKVQFGEDAEVREIKAFTYVVQNITVFHRKVYNRLDGVITVDGKTYEAYYIVTENEIYSEINYEIIKNSIKNYFAYLNLDIVSVSWKLDYPTNALPNSIKSYEDLLKNKKWTAISVYVDDNSLANISKDDFIQIRDYWREYDTDSRYDIYGNISFIRAPGTGQKSGDVGSVNISYNREEEDINFTVNYLSETEATEQAAADTLEESAKKQKVIDEIIGRR